MSSPSLLYIYIYSLLSSPSFHPLLLFLLSSLPSQARRCALAVSTVETASTSSAALHSTLAEERRQRISLQSTLLRRISTEQHKTAQAAAAAEKAKQECELIQQDKEKLKTLLELEHQKVVQLQRSLVQMPSQTGKSPASIRPPSAPLASPFTSTSVPSRSALPPRKESQSILDKESSLIVFDDTYFKDDGETADKLGLFSGS